MDDIIKLLSTTITKKGAVRISRQLINDKREINQLIDLTFFPEKEIGFRAAWVLEQIIFSNFQLFLPHLNHFISLFPQVKNESCKRHYAKIMQELSLHFISKKPNPTLLTAMKQLDLDPVTETLFDWLIDPKTKIAVKAFCMESLYNLNTIYPWINEELPSQIDFLMKNGSPGIQSRGKKIIAKIEKQVNRI